MAHGKAILGTFVVISWISFAWTGASEHGYAWTSRTETSLPGLGITPPADPGLQDEQKENEGNSEEDELVYEVVPQLVPPSDQCSDRWANLLGEPSKAEKSWREQLNHGIYRIGIDETVLARVELLSSASPTACEGTPDWKKRQTQMLITYYLDDGSTKEVLYEFLEDDIYYDRSPDVYAAGGFLVLHGVNYEGSNVQITLELELLRELYDSASPTALPAPAPLRA